MSMSADREITPVALTAIAGGFVGGVSAPYIENVVRPGAVEARNHLRHDVLPAAQAKVVEAYDTYSAASSGHPYAGTTASTSELRQEHLDAAQAAAAVQAQAERAQCEQIGIGTVGIVVGALLATGVRVAVARLVRSKNQARQ